MQKYLQNLLELEIRDPVKNFVAQVLNFMDQDKRFRSFPSIALAAATLNPQRALPDQISVSELEEGKTYIRNLIDEYSTAVTDPTSIEVINVDNESFSVMFERAFADVNFETKVPRLDNEFSLTRVGCISARCGRRKKCLRLFSATRP